MNVTQSTSCPRTEDLAGILLAGPGDERREHIEGCARCRAQLAELRTFLEPGSVPGARVEEAELALAAAFDREWRAEHATPTAAPRVAQPARPSFWETLFAPALRPAWSMAAVVMVAGIMWVALKPGDNATVRGDGAQVVETLAPVAADGSVTLEWKSVPGADRYEVTFLDDGLSDLGAPVTVGEPRLVVSRDALPAGLISGARVMYQVSARSGERELMHSVTQSVTLP